MFEEKKDIKEQAEKKSGDNVLKHALFKTLPYLIVALLVGGGAYYLVKTKPQIFGLTKDTAAEAQKEVDTLVSEVGKLMSLPADERPTVATVTDTDKVKDQPFFKNAQKDDKVLVYTNAKKAILYRPSEKRIIEVGSVNMGSQQGVQTTPVTSVTTAPTQTPQNTQ